MTLWRPSRRVLLKTSAISAAGALIGAPRIARADPKEVVVGGPAGAAKYFKSDVFPLIEKKLGIKVIYEGTNSLTNLQKMTADKDAPKMSVVIMDDPVMLVAAKEGLITPITVAGSPNLAKLAPANVHQDGMWANYQIPWAGIAFNTQGGKAPTSWNDLMPPTRRARSSFLRSRTRRAIGPFFPLPISRPASLTRRRNMKLMLASRNSQR
jgi:putative spermidine/putrescine transport system substrate-binding protein